MIYQTIINKVFKVSYLVLGIIPILWVIVLIIFHHYMSFEFGYSPTYNKPEYSEIFSNAIILNLCDFLLLFWIISMCCSVFIYPIVFLINLVLKFTNKVNINYKSILFCLIGYMVFWLMMILSSPYGNTFSWILD